MDNLWMEKREHATDEILRLLKLQKQDLQGLQASDALADQVQGVTLTREIHYLLDNLPRDLKLRMKSRAVAKGISSHHFLADYLIYVIAKHIERLEEEKLLEEILDWSNKILPIRSAQTEAEA